MGHMMRCITIAKQMRKQGGKTVFFTADGYAGDMLEKAGMDWICLHTVWKQIEEYRAGQDIGHGVQAGLAHGADPQGGVDAIGVVVDELRGGIMKIIVVSARTDEQVYKEAAKRRKNHDLY